MAVAAVMAIQPQEVLVEAVLAVLQMAMELRLKQIAALAVVEAAGAMVKAVLEVAA